MLFNIEKIKFSKKQLETSISKGFEEIYWDDLRAPASGLNPTGPTSPATVDTTDGSLVFTTGNAIVAWFQMPHNWKQGSILKPHIHWAKTTSAAGIVNWKIKYKMANIGDVFSSFTTLASGINTISDSNTAYKHALTEFADINAYGKTLSSMLCLYLERVTSGDTYGADVNLYEIDVHYQVDGFGSDREYVKSLIK